MALAVSTKQLQALKKGWQSQTSMDHGYSPASIYRQVPHPKIGLLHISACIRDIHKLWNRLKVRRHAH